MANSMKTSDNLLNESSNAVIPTPPLETMSEIDVQNRSELEIKSELNNKTHLNDLVSELG